MTNRAHSVPTHGRRKQIERFCRVYMDGNPLASPEDFVEAKEEELCDEQDCASVTFRSSLLLYFYKYLKAECEAKESEFYKLVDMMSAWEKARRALAQDG